MIFTLVFILDQFIMEEYEKAVSRVPRWKIQFCKKNLKNMIGTDDKELAADALMESTVERRSTTKGKAACKKKTMRMSTRQRTKKQLTTKKTLVSNQLGKK